MHKSPAVIFVLNCPNGAVKFPFNNGNYQILVVSKMLIAFMLALYLHDFIE